MSKTSLLNLVLFIIVISLALFIYFSEEETTELNRLTNVDLNDITRITIKHNNKTTTIQKQAHNKWQITQPIVIAANSFRLKSILRLLNAPVHNSYTLSEINTDVFGLINPTTTIQFNETIVSFGITNPATNLRYVQLDNLVYTINDVYYPLISSYFGTLVSLSLIPDDSSIEKLVLLNQTISKDKNSLWQSTSNIDGNNIDDSNINSSATGGDDIIKTIDNWKTIQAFGIHEYIQRKRLGQVTIYLKGENKPLTFQMTEKNPWLILARPELGLEYHLNVEAYDSLVAPK